MWSENRVVCGNLYVVSLLCGLIFNRSAVHTKSFHVFNNFIKFSWLFKYSAEFQRLESFCITWIVMHCAFNIVPLSIFPKRRRRVQICASFEIRPKRGCAQIRRHCPWISDRISIFPKCNKRIALIVFELWLFDPGTFFWFFFIGLSIVLFWRFNLETGARFILTAFWIAAFFVAYFFHAILKSIHFRRVEVQLARCFLITEKILRSPRNLCAIYVENFEDLL